MPSDIEFAAARRRGEKESDGNKPLGSGHLDRMAVAAQQYRQAKSELMALKEASAGDGAALQGALERFERARCAVKEAISI